jgi:hypothetical protein
VVELDLTRRRKHMVALGGGEKRPGGGVAAAPLVKRVLEAEDRLETLRRNKETATHDLERAREAVREALRRLGER